ncbi:MAG: hypothetical protein ACQEXI_12330 [Pseudomonadota bacterium]
MSRISISGNSLEVHSFNGSKDSETPSYCGTGRCEVNGRHVGAFEGYVSTIQKRHEDTDALYRIYTFDKSNFTVMITDEWQEYVEKEVPNYKSDLSRSVEEAMTDEINVPEVSVAVDPRIYTEEGWNSGFFDVDIVIDPSNMATKQGIRREAMVFERVPFEIDENGLEFSGDNDDEFNESLSQFFYKYSVSERGQEIARDMIMVNIEAKLGEYGIGDYQSAVNFDDSKYQQSAIPHTV